MTRTVEYYDTWAYARERLDQLRLAGYVVYAVDLEERIAVHISCGRRHADLSQMPKPRRGK